MSKVVILGFPKNDHFIPLVNIVRELINRGEQVIYYSTNAYMSRISDLGAEFRSYKADELFELQDDAEYVSGIDYYSWQANGLMNISKVILDNISDEVVNDSPDYLLYDSLSLWGRILANEMQIAHCSFITSFAINMESVYENLDDFASFDLGMPGLPHEKTKRIVHLMFKTLENKYGTGIFNSPAPMNIVFTSEYFQVNSHCFGDIYSFIGAPMEKCEYPIWKESKLSASEKKVSVVLSGLSKKYHLIISLLIEALSDSNFQVYVYKEEGDIIRENEELPTNFVISEFSLDRELVKECDIFICHGSMYNVTESLFCDIPVLIFPETSEQFVVANQVKKLGAGLYLADDEIDLKSIHKSIENLSSINMFKENARLIGESLRNSGGYKRAVDIILENTKKATFS